MAKIPVGKTVEYAYGFAAGNFLTVLGIAWFALLISIGGGFLLLPPSSVLPANGLLTRPLLLVFYVVTVVLAAAVKVGVLRRTLGLASGPVYFYISLEPVVWRLIGAYLLYFLALFGIILGAFVGGALLDLLLGGAAALAFGAAVGTGVASAVALILALCLFPAAIYMAVRLFFLLPATVVAEDRISLGRGWQLMKGNFWRAFVTWLAVLLPIFLVYIGLMVTFFGSELLPPIHANLTPDEMNAWNTRLIGLFRQNILILEPAYVVFSVLLLGLDSAAPAFAYRSLAPAPEGIAAEFA